MAVTAAVVTEIVHMSRRWKDNLVAYGICMQTLVIFMDLMPLKPDHPLVCPVCPGSFQHPVLNSNSVTIKPCIRIGHMSNQRKAEFISNNFGIKSF
jgi:hypothetical protein